MKTRLFFCALTLILMGCDKQIQQFVNTGAKHPIADLLDPVVHNASEKTIKVSPGANIADSPQAAARYTLTPTQVELTGTQANARVSINQARME